MDLRYYKILGFNNDKATKDEIKTAYRTFSKGCHPDLFPDDKEKENEFKRLTEAYELLLDPNRRHTYDKYGYNETDDEDKLYKNAESEFVNLFEQVFDNLPDHALEQVDLKKVMLEVLKNNSNDHNNDIKKIERAIRKLEIPLRKMKSKTKKNLIATHLNNRILSKHSEIERKRKIIRILGIMEVIAEDYNYESNSNFILPSLSNSATFKS